jgi:hypothetical protein
MGAAVTAFEQFLATEYPDTAISQLSESNNSVFLVQSTAGPIVAKHVTDVDISLAYLAEANARLADFVPVQKIFRVYQTEQGDPFDAVLAEYVEGTDLATVLAENESAIPADQLAGYLVDFVTACRALPRIHDAFGMYKRSAPIIDSYQEFLEYYARRYWGRVRPFYAGTPIGDAVDEWVDGGFAAAARSHPAPFTVVPVDANLKNFIVTPQGAIVALNLPIAAVSTPAHAVAAISVHLRHRAVHQRFLELVADGLCKDDFAMVAHFELWTIIGILSFYAVREPDRRGEWRDWGSPVLLDDDFIGLVQSLLCGSDRR